MQFDILTVFFSGLQDGLAPDMFVILVFFFAYLGLAQRNSQNLLMVGLPFILMVLFTYLIERLGFLDTVFLFEALLDMLIQVSYLATALSCLLLGILIFRDLGAVRQRLSDKARAKFSGRPQDNTDNVVYKSREMYIFVIWAVIAGFVFPLVELSSTSGRGWPRASVPFFYLGLYYLAFIMPCIATLILIHFVYETRWWKSLTDRYFATARFIGGIVCVALALWVGWMGRFWFPV
ncbi:MAG: hypothetical protein GY832_12480 [Chloroflexi bacterium]|nr:hypothetical protein [Chloroflexota bacterium]